MIRPVEVAPGAVHLPGWLTLDRQAFVVNEFRIWAAGPVPPTAAQGPRSRDVGSDGLSRLALAAVPLYPGCLERERSTSAADAGLADRTRPGVRWRRSDAVGAASYEPDTALVNYYGDAAKMGMHQDKDEVSLAPVVSLSVGDSCRFRFGNTETRTRPYVDLTLESGDLFVFGGPSRLAYHGVTRILPGTAPAGCGLDSGRINITLRETGL